MDKEQTEKNKKNVDTLIHKLKQNSESLHIGRIPISAKRAFVDLANEEFCGDYGMCLKFLVEGIPNADIGILQEALEGLNERITRLENPVEKPKKSVKKMLNGKEVKVK